MAPSEPDHIAAPANFQDEYWYEGTPPPNGKPAAGVWPVWADLRPANRTMKSTASGRASSVWETVMMADQQVVDWHDLLDTSLVASTSIEARIYGRLTARELDVALAVAEGSSNRDIAIRLCISQKTVEYHLGNIFGKLGVRSRTQLTLALLRTPSTQFPRLGDVRT